MFVEMSRLVAHNPPALHNGVAVADLDGDGQFEFVVAGFGGPNRLLRWSNGQLRDVAPPELADAEALAVGLAAGDFDGDGREELYILNTDSFSGTKRVSDRLFDSQPDRRWVDLFARPENEHLLNRAADRNVSVIDRRGVGRYGFFVANHDEPMRLFERGPDCSLTDLAPPLSLGLTTCGRGALTLPVFGFHPDIICVNEHGPNLVFRNRGDGTFDECAIEMRLDDPGEQGRGIAAFDAGGEFGLCLGNWEGPHRLMIRRENATWKDHATAGLAFPSAIGTVIAADFDNDGHDELFFNNIGEPNRLFRVLANPDRETRSIRPVADVLGSPEIVMLDPGEALDPDGFGTGAAICDIDGDGILELLVARGDRGPQPLSVYKSRLAEGNNWLRVRPLTRFGAPARGTVVRAEAGERVRVKGVCGGSGYQCQMEPIAHFGLGPGGHAERVQVTWPDGSGVILLNPGVNRTITVPYPRG